MPTETLEETLQVFRVKIKYYEALDVLQTQEIRRLSKQVNKLRRLLYEKAATEISKK